MVPVGFAACFGVVLVTVLFDPFGVHHLFAFAGTGRSVDRSFVVTNQGDQPSQGSRITVKPYGYMQTTACVDSTSASVDLVDCVFDLSYAIDAFEYWANKLATFASAVFRSDASIAFCFPTGW